MLVESLQEILPQSCNPMGVEAPRKRLAGECSIEFLEWIRSNTQEAYHFSKMLVNMLKHCFLAKQFKAGKPVWMESVWKNSIKSELVLTSWILSGKCFLILYTVAHQEIPSSSKRL